MKFDFTNTNIFYIIKLNDNVFLFAFFIIKIKEVYTMKIDVQKFQEPLLKVSTWVDRNTILQAIKNAFVRTIPFTVVGSFSNLIKMQLDALIKNQRLDNAILNNIRDLFGYIGSATLGIVALIVVFSSAYSYAFELQRKEKTIN